MLKEIESKIFPFRFQCIRCGNCCTHLPQGVPLFYKDAYEIGLNFNMSLRDFVAKYCELETHEITNNGERLHIPGLYLKKIGQTCIFYKDNACSINSVKPYNCQHAPFISLLFQSDTAIKFLKDNCKGFGQGTYYSKNKIKVILDREVGLEINDMELYERGLFNSLQS